MMYYHYGMGPGFDFGWFFMIIFWALVIWAVIALIRSTRGYNGKHHHGRCECKNGHCHHMEEGHGPHHHHEGHHSSHRHALDLLEERYVKGEISKEEYHEKKKDLLS